MKHALMPLALMACVNAHAAEYANPYSPYPPAPSAVPSAPPPPLPMPMGGMPHLALDDALPPAFTENRSVFDVLEVVGRSATFAVLRYPMTGSSAGANVGTSTSASANAGAGAATSAQGISYRKLIVRSEKTAFIGGRSFKVVLPGGGTNVLLVDSKNGKVLWEGDLSEPKIYYTSPNVTDYQYTPPASAGTGVGQASNAGGLATAFGQSTAGQSTTGQSAAGSSTAGQQAVPPGGATR